ncbi:MAG: hypothetical protein ABWK01_09505 [Infirmifilum sp.]
MSQTDLLSMLILIINDVIASIPKIFLVAAIILATFILIKLVNRVIKWLVSIGRFEETLKEIIPEGTRLSLTTLLSIFADVAILIAASALIIRLHVPEGNVFYQEAVGYIARAGSVVILSILAFVMVDAVVKSMKLERKTERFFVMLSALIFVILIVDLAALSNEVKVALTAGLALGVGLLIGVFSLWAFFGDYIEEITVALRRLEPKTSSQILAERELPPE